MINDLIIDRREKFLHKYVTYVIEGKKNPTKNYLGFDTFELIGCRCVDWDVCDTKEEADEWIKTYPMPSTDDQTYAEIWLIYMDDKRFRPKTTYPVQEDKYWFDCVVEGDFLEHELFYNDINDYVLKYSGSRERLSDEKCRFANKK